MWQIVQGITSLVEVSDVKTDYETFRLHYTFTVGVLLTFFIIVTTKQFVGSPIVCDFLGSVTPDVINSYCWIHSTYVIPKAFYKEVGVEVPHPGIDGTQDPKEFRYIKYYQWVYFMLFFQAILFYFPKWLWKSWEGDKMKKITKELENVLLPEEELKEKFKSVTNYLVNTWKSHDTYAAKYFFCEFLAFINVAGQFFFLDLFFDGQFQNFGFKVIQFFESDQQNASGNFTDYVKGDPMIMLFPRVTKCIFRKFGRSSLIEVNDVLCVMALNVINEKVYLFLWFWFIALSCFTLLAVFMDCLLMISPSTRIYTLQARFHLMDEKDLRVLVRKGSFGDWFLIDLIGQNIDHMLFSEIVSTIARKLTHDYKVV
ncbi:innexin shaking-B-like [Argiope bruennichi]|uniref:innexin shaking-B-like n=1 Tax=Argiope bruennichi TaxID=94029 RepID=UPI00249582D2|nr:innexin shaking-B-like [Argiope bruennichi]